MKQAKIKNINGLVPYLTDNGITYQVVQDGWFILVSYHDDTDLFNIAFYFGKRIAAKELLPIT